MGSETTQRDNSLDRDIGLFGATSTVIAGVLGAGLFVTIGTASSTTGPSVILVVALAGILALFIAINYSYLVTIFPAAGSAYTFLSRCYENRLIGFAVSWSKWLGFMAANATLAIGFGNYFQVFFPAIPPKVSGFALLTVLMLVNLIGTRRYSISQNAIFTLLILSLLILLIPGSFSIHTENYTPFFTGGMDGFIAAAVPLFFAYIGIGAISELGAEIKNPGRNLPLSMLVGSLVLIVLYMWTAAVIYGVVADYTVLANSAQPLATAAEEFLGGYATALVAFGGLLATASSVHAVIVATIKMPYSWAWDEIFPEWFSVVNERWGTPHWSLVVLYAASSGLLFWSAGLSQALRLATFSYLIPFVAVSITAAYIYMNKQNLANRASFDIGGWLYVSAAIGALGSVLLLVQAAEGALVIYVPWLLVGLVIFTGYWYRGQRTGSDISAILATLPGVPSEEYDPNIGVVHASTKEEQPTGSDDPTS
ncbi:MAG TPA: APC family permease [Halococcus sp.]|nr:APC family permease [Halococcus sp.]